VAVRFLFGRAGSGKTHYCLHAVREHLRKNPIDGPALILFIPEQATVQTERMLLSDKDLVGASRYHTMSFRRLQQIVLADTGFANRELVGPVGRQMIVQYLLTRSRQQLQVLGKVADRPGTAAKVAASIVEWMEEGILAPHVASLAGQVRELGRAGVRGSHADKVPRDLLAGKLDDLGLIYQEYLKWLAEGRQADPAALLAEMADRLERCQWLCGAHVWVDGFASFSAQQRYALARLAQVAGQVEIALLMDPDVIAGDQPVEPYDLFYRTWQTCRQLREAMVEANVDIDEPVVLRASPPARFRERPVLGRIESRLFAAAGPADSPESGAKVDSEIEIVAAPGRLAEVEAVARKIVDLTRVAPPSKALRYRQIAVLVRDLEPYHDYFQTVFAAHGIPLFIDRRRSVSHHPLVELVRALLRLMVDDWPIDAVAAMLKTSLVPVPRNRADLVENYLLAHGITGWENWCGGQWGYLRRFVGADEDPADPSPQEQQTLRKVNHARRVLYQLLRAWAGPGTTDNVSPAGATAQGPGPRPDSPAHPDSLRYAPSTSSGQAVAGTTAASGQPRSRLATGRQWAELLYTTLEQLKVPRRLMRWQKLAAIHGGPAGLEQGQQHKQVWGLLTQLLDDLVAGLGEEPMEAAQFQATIEAGLEAFSLPLIPPVVDQVVVGSVDRSRQPDITAAFVVGFNEGLFPHRAGQDVLLCDHERDLLSQLDGSGGLMTGKQRLFDERLLAYIGLTRASRYVWVSYAAADQSGRTLEPSPYLRALKAVLPGAAVRHLHDPLMSLHVDQVGTIWQAATGVVLAGRTAVASGQWPVVSGDNYDNNGPAEAGTPNVGCAPHTNSAPNEDTAQAKACTPNKSPPKGGATNKDTARAEARRPNADGWAALGQWMMANLTLAQKVRRVVSACDYTNGCAVRPEQAKQLFGEQLHCSVSQLQEYAVCPYRYFAHYGLQLKERPEFELAAVELGSFYHRILYKLALNVRQRGHSLRTVPYETLNSLVNETTDEELREVVKELALTDGREAYLLERAKVDIGSALRGHLALWKNSLFDPFALEAGFGTKDGWQGLEIRTPKGRCAVLRGKIDRIDAASIGQTNLLAVIDYKRSSRYKLRLDDALAGLQVQLIVYMKAAMQAAGKDRPGGGEAVPGGMYYFNLLPTWEKVAPGDLIDPARGQDLKQWQLAGLTNKECLPAFRQDHADGQQWPINVYESSPGKIHGSAPAVDSAEFRTVIEQVWRSLGETVDGILDGDFAVQPYKAGREMPCPYCLFDTVCRFGPEFNHYRTIVRRGSVKRTLETLGPWQDKATS
jgi:ATP-dependent helicase/nuclease subunit B